MYGTAAGNNKRARRRGFAVCGKQVVLRRRRARRCVGHCAKEVTQNETNVTRRVVQLAWRCHLSRQPPPLATTTRGPSQALEFLFKVRWQHQ